MYICFFRCISEGRCRTPVCEFGSYRDAEGRGRCPQKSEQYLPLQEGLEVMPRHVPAPPPPSRHVPAPQMPRHVQAPPNPPIPEPSWPRLLPSRPNGVPRVEVPPSWASSDNKKDLTWQPLQGLFVMPTPAALSSRPSIRSAPSTTTSTTTTPAPPPAAPRGPHWDPQPITTAPATYSWQTQQQQQHHQQPKTHEPSKHHWATMPKWSFSSSDHNSGFPWNPEETMRFKHNKKAWGAFLGGWKTGLVLFTRARVSLFLEFTDGWVNFSTSLEILKQKYPVDRPWSVLALLKLWLNYLCVDD